jgi:hypothetical protein
MTLHAQNDPCIHDAHTCSTVERSGMLGRHSPEVHHRPQLTLDAQVCSEQADIVAEWDAHQEIQV